MNIISFSLWGNNPKYTIGAIENAKLAKQVYPEWICYYFIDSKVPKPIIDELSTFDNVILTVVEENSVEEGHSNHTAAFWRFTLASEPNIDIVIFRDTDSRLTLRERILVDEFVASSKTIHSIKDHPGHLGNKIMAGMWGVKKGTLIDIEDRINNFLGKIPPQGLKYGVDQQFLELIHGEFYSQILEHNPFNDEVFNAPRVGFDFVGQVYDQNNIPNVEYAEELKQLIVNRKCTRHCDKIKYLR